MKVNELADTFLKLMREEERQLLSVDMMTQEQKNALGLWAMKMYELGQHIVEDISDVKYDGRLIILQDGTRWEVDSMDSSTADMWSSFDKVVVIDNEMYKLDELEKVSVEQEFN
jgi:hypothetical protein